MFTGIVAEVGCVESLRRKGGILQAVIRAPRTARVVRVKGSVAVDGVCLTVTARAKASFRAEIIPETARLTTLGGLRKGSRVHLEPSLRADGRVDGHWVLGHVDGQGRVLRVIRKGAHRGLRIGLQPSLCRLLVPKGPIAVDGVSLTLGTRVTGRSFEVFLIPETLKQTRLGGLAEADRVNIEVDYLAKLVDRRYSASQH